MSFKTDQEEFWAGNFGDEYVERNKDERFTATNIALFAKVLSHTQSISSIIEFGSSIGLSLIALRKLLPKAELSAIEINQKAVKQLEQIGDIKTFPISVFDFKPDYPRDFVFTKGFLIHINPEMLSTVYELLYETSSRYICVVEYYNPTPVEVTYRGHKGKLYKRDFAGELMDKFDDLKLIDYGFVYHRDDNYPQDDMNWFLLEKVKCN